MRFDHALPLLQAALVLVCRPGRVPIPERLAEQVFFCGRMARSEAKSSRLDRRYWLRLRLPDAPKQTGGFSGRLFETDMIVRDATGRKLLHAQVKVVRVSRQRNPQNLAIQSGVEPRGLMKPTRPTRLAKRLPEAPKQTSGHSERLFETRIPPAAPSSLRVPLCRDHVSRVIQSPSRIWIGSLAVLQIGILCAS